MVLEIAAKTAKPLFFIQGNNSLDSTVIFLFETANLTIQLYYIPIYAEQLNFNNDWSQHNDITIPFLTQPLLDTETLSYGRN